MINTQFHIAFFENKVQRFASCFWLLFFMFSFFGCKDFTEVGVPTSQLSSATVFKEVASADAAMSDVYAKLRDQGIINGGIDGMTSQLGSYADEFRSYGIASSTSSLFYNNNLLANTRTVGDWWKSSYNSIYACNSIIEGLANSFAVAQKDKDRIMGEAYFMRAFQHFYLTNLYGPIPYITGTDYNQNMKVQRQTVTQVYIQLESDLLLAISLMPDAYTNALRVRPNKGAAKALLARVYLFEGKWAEAAKQASEVIDNPLYVWEPNLNKVFLKESTSTIFQLVPPVTGGNTIESTTFYFTSGPPSRVALAQSLMSSFEIGDQRRINWIASVTQGTGGPYYRPFKYKSNTNTGTTMEYAIVFRLAETYLIRAEALARQGQLSSALTDLNFIRNNAGLDKTSATIQQEIINAILQERRIELFAEHGHRFFDLKRYGNLDAVLGSIKSGWQTTDALIPLPESELLLNPALNPQNSGY